MDEDRDETEVSHKRTSSRLLKQQALDLMVQTRRMLLRLPPGRYVRYHRWLLNQVASDLRTVAGARVVEIMEMIDSIICCILMRINFRAKQKRRAKMQAKQRQ
uniref:Uncharacterized protein n=1 Tax=Anopheles merus TaxID=30066 RepID=A0A182UMU4_ANOME